MAAIYSLIKKIGVPFQLKYASLEDQLNIKFKGCVPQHLLEELIEALRGHPDIWSVSCSTNIVSKITTGGECLRLYLELVALDSIEHVGQVNCRYHSHWENPSRLSGQVESDSDESDLGSNSEEFVDYLKSRLPQEGEDDDGSFEEKVKRVLDKLLPKL